MGYNVCINDLEINITSMLIKPMETILEREGELFWKMVTLKSIQDQKRHQLDMSSHYDVLEKNANLIIGCINREVANRIKVIIYICKKLI